MAAHQKETIIEFNTSRLGLPVAAIVPAWQSRSILPDCLSALESQDVVKIEILVCDKGSNDETREFVQENHPKAAYIESDPGLGIAAALNRGLEAAGDAPYLAVVYPGTRLRYDALVRLLRTLREEAEAGIAVPRIMHDEEPERIKCEGVAVTSGFETFTLSNLMTPLKDEEKPLFVPAPAESCMMMRKEVYDCIGGFDEHYFCGWEMIDYSMRAYLKGYRCCYVPDAEAYELGRQFLHPWSREYVYEHCRAALATAAKHLSLPKLLLRMPLLLATRLRVAALFAGGGRLGAALRGEFAAFPLAMRMALKRRTLPRAEEDYSAEFFLQRGDRLREALRHKKKPDMDWVEEREV
ncbi:MAG: glycosyltransferase family 2 protein [Planctomycetota bacterium]